MKNRVVLIILLLSLKLILFSQNQNIIDFNNRAYVDILSTPAISIYYAEKSLNENIEIEDEGEYFKSLFVLARAYYAIDDFYMTKNSILKILSFIERTNYSYRDSDFYSFSARYFWESNNHELLMQILSNDQLYSTVSERVQVEFNILKIYIDMYENQTLNSDLTKESRAICDSAGFIDLKGELNIIEGDYLLGSNRGRAKTLYKEVLEMSNQLNRAEALIRFGDINSSLLYYEEAYLVSESVRDYAISMEILEKLYGEYKKLGDYKSLTVVLEKMEYYKNKKSQFILNQYKELYNFGFHREHLTLKLESRQTQITQLKSVIIFMGVAILTLIIFLSIQLYRVRGINI